MATYTNTWEETLPLTNDKTGNNLAGKVYTILQNMALNMRERMLKNMPVGAIMAWSTDLIPDGWLECDGDDDLLRVGTYADLYAVIGTTYGTKDSSHFTLPKYKGRFVRGWNHSKATGLYDPDVATRTASTATGATMTAGDHVGTEQTDENKIHNHIYDFGQNSSLIVGNHSPLINSNTPSNGTEARPKNIYVRYIIRYLKMTSDSSVFDYIKTWNESVPVSTDLMGLIPVDHIRGIKKALRERLDNLFPVGMLAWWPNATAPEGWFECDGAAVSRTIYDSLFDNIGVMYGPGDSSNTFNLPNYKGYFLRAQADDATVDTLSATRTDRGDGVGGEFTGSKQIDDNKSHTHTYSYSDNSLSGLGDELGYARSALWGYHPLGDNPVFFDINGNSGAGQTPTRIVDGRPKNIYLMVIIKAEGVV